MTILNSFISRRAYYEAHPEEVVAAIEKGTAAARAKAAETLSEVKAAMKIDYFEKWEEQYGVKEI